MMNSIDCAGIENNNNYVKYQFFVLQQFVYVNYSCINPFKSKSHELPIYESSLNK